MSAGCPWAEALRGVPAGSVRVVQPDGAPAAPLRAETDGRGRIEAYRVFPGIDAAFGMFCASRAAFRHEAREEVLSLDYCCAGRIGWDMRCGAAVYLGEGDLSLHSQACCADSSMTFPLGFAAEVSLSVDLGALARACPEILAAAGFDAQALRARFCGGGAFCLPASPELAEVFSPLLRAPADLRPAYLALKSQELLLYLWRQEGGAPALQRVHAQQTEQVRKVHAFLVSHLDRRYTIEDLSRQFLLNTATLKSAFKAVYGQPIATYMKEARVREAMRLLRETDSSIADIAAAVGYESQGKFTKAFKDVAQALPTEYRRQHRA